MTERATIHQVVQIGPESVKGTTPGSGADIKLLATEIMLKRELNVTAFRPVGYKFPAIASPGQKWASGSIGGVPAYNDLTWLFASALMTPTPAQQAATAAYKSTFTMDSDGPDSVTTLYVQQGSSVRAHSLNYGLVNEIGLNFSRESGELSGAILGRAFTDDVTLTVGPTEQTQMPILPEDIDIWVDDTAANLGTTQFDRVLRAEWRLANRYGPVWALKTAEASWAAEIELEPEMTLALTVEADSEGMGLLTQAEAGTKRFIRLKAVGPLIEDTYYYTLQLDMCGGITEMSDFSDEQGVYAVTWTFTGMHDTTWAKALSIELTNVVSAL